MIIAGIDEAGRGPCFGPMALGIYAIEKKDENFLKELGVRDSKELLPSKREKLFPQLKSKGKHKVIILSSVQINDLMAQTNLNDIEAMQIAKLIEEVEADVYYIDSPDAVKGKFESRIRKYLPKDKQKVKIIAENKADSKYLVVGGASILAKVTRDKEIEKLCEKYGDFGSGYPSDPKTKKFLEEYVKKNKALPPFSRIFWSTCKVAMEKAGTEQQKLF